MDQRMEMVLSSVVEAKIGKGRMTSDEVRSLLNEISDEAMKLDTLKMQVRNLCSHEDAKGKRTTNPTGGGMAQCWVCHGEID